MQRLLAIFVILSVIWRCIESLNCKSLEENVPVSIGIMLGATESDSNAKCRKDISEILNGIAERQLWALQILDASGNRQNPFVWGENLWLGSKEACLASNNPPSVIVSEKTVRLKELLKITSPIAVDYRILSGNVEAPQQKQMSILFSDSSEFQLGICLPKSCTLPETLKLAQQFFRAGNVSNFFDISVTFDRVRDFNDASLWENTSFRAAAVIFLAVALVTFLARHSEEFSGGNLSRFISCFHFTSNFTATMSTDVHPGSVSSVAGLKTISCLWIIGMHVMYFNIITLRIPLDSAKFDNIAYFLLFRSVLAVDIFFMISGLLMAYNFLRRDTLHRQIQENSLADNAKLLVRFILHRYLRLAPVILISSILSRMVFLYLDSVNALPMGFCPGVECKYWYRNMLFVQNFYPIQDMCNRWSWHLACDMQLYGIFMLILFIQAKYPQRGRFLLALVTTGGVLLTFILCLYHKFQLSVLGVFEAIDTVYTPLWYRIFAYGVGIFAAMIITAAQEVKMPVFSSRSVRIYVGSSLIFLVTQVLSDAASRSVFYVAFLWSVGRFLLAVFMASYLCLAHWGYLLSFAKFASSKFCTRMNKLSYTMYMFHSVFARFAFGGRLPPSELSYPMIIVSYFGILIITYGFSILCTTFIEVPFQRISEEFLMKPLWPKPANNVKNQKEMK
ncbi:O-acyltransferase like protein-like [Phlebotomus argentipes]|uniref:O-acyltransferase like protein-like n=1 Tax=Phlebotomus argentipes TaxID=94469 RepID=UPI002892FA8A|nr:O-acyltransferase like protein-like [Phlebotomus argentipes]